mgnify:CR=1 FL=1
MRSGTVWTWKPKGGRFSIIARTKREHGYRYDGDDENGETQAKLDSGEYVAFGTIVTVYLDGEPIGEDSIWGSVYADGEESQFWTGHRDADPMNRNCSIMRAARGGNVCICHYFPDLVREAISEARQHVRDMTPVPYVRESAR